MAKGDKFKKLLNNPNLIEKFEHFRERYLLILALAYKDDPESFYRLEGFTWPNGQAVLISRRRKLIENGQASAEVMQIYETPFYAEVGHGEPEFRRLIELVFARLGYEAGRRNQIRELLSFKPDISEMLV